jgi:hypothetical protein
MRWSKKGIWQIIFNTLAVSADTEWLMIDSTIIKAHQNAEEGICNRPQINQKVASVQK